MADPIQALSDWLLYAVGGGLTLIGGYARRVDGNAKEALDKAEENERALFGTDDPNADGVLQIAKGNGEKIDTLSTRMDTQHRELMEKFEELRDRVEQGTGGDFYRGGGSDADPADG